jgi:CheY-like chemotaxis protein
MLSGGPGAGQRIEVTGMHARGTNQGKPSLSVLVVDDNEVNQLYLRHLLRRMGHDPFTTGDGRETLEAVASRPFDLILMDLNLPDTDGLALTRAIRDGRGVPVNPPDIPILAITAFTSAKDRARCLEAGMNGHLGKPLRVEELEAAMERLLPASTNADAASAAAGTFDLSAFTRESRPDFAFEMLTLFLQVAEPKRTALRAALEAGDIQAAVAAAHDLAGMAGPLRADRLHETMKAVQEACQAGDLAAGRAMYVRADRELATVLGAVRAHPYLAAKGS